jgi:caffeoyl-CoA O-methyltransferase
MARELIDSTVGEYLTRLVPARPAEMQAMEATAAQSGFPIVGPAAGHFCYLVARLIGARQVFELGSGFGYSTAWFARAVDENGGGTVHHTVWDEELSRQARRHLAALGYADLVTYRVGEAVEALQRVEGPFDLIFCDIDKVGYPAAVPVIQSRLRSGGVLIADNLLWHGQIFDATDLTPDTQGIREFTRLVTEDADWTASVVPIRDGLLVARRR